MAWAARFRRAHHVDERADGRSATGSALWDATASRSLRKCGVLDRGAPRNIGMAVSVGTNRCLRRGSQFSRRGLAAPDDEDLNLVEPAHDRSTVVAELNRSVISFTVACAPRRATHLPGCPCLSRAGAGWANSRRWTRRASRRTTAACPPSLERAPADGTSERGDRGQPPSRSHPVDPDLPRASRQEQRPVKRCSGRALRMSGRPGCGPAFRLTGRARRSPRAPANAQPIMGAGDQTRSNDAHEERQQCEGRRRAESGASESRGRSVARSGCPCHPPPCHETRPPPSRQRTRHDPQRHPSAVGSVSSSAPGGSMPPFDRAVSDRRATVRATPRQHLPNGPDR
jgi:hypothetical protein